MFELLAATARAEVVPVGLRGHEWILSARLEVVGWALGGTRSASQLIESTAAYDRGLSEHGGASLEGANLARRQRYRDTARLQRIAASGFASALCVRPLRDEQEDYRETDHPPKYGSGHAIGGQWRLRDHSHLAPLRH
jgi:hypothetical protein